MIDNQIAIQIIILKWWSIIEPCLLIKNYQRSYDH